MFQKINTKFNDNQLLIVLGIIISLFPLCFLIGSLFINLNTLLACLIIILYLFNTKNLLIFRNKFFYALIFLWISLLINLYFSSNFENSLSRIFGFVRFIFLALSIKIFLENASDKLQRLVFKIWLLIFLVISFDLIFEYFLGFNTFGFSSYMPGRLSGFLNQELKIGHLYSALVLLISIFIFKFYNNNYYFYFGLITFVTISLLIGERSNFLKVLFISSIFIFVFDKKYLLNKLVIFLILTLSLTTFVTFNEDYNKRFWGQFIKPIIFANSKTVKIGETDKINIKNFFYNSVYGANYNRGYKVFLDNKVFGVGIKNYRNESNKKKYENKKLRFNNHASSIHPHQVHLEFLAETGLFGYISFVLFIFYSIYHSLKNFLVTKNLIILASLLYFIFSLMPLIPTGSFFTTFGATLFWINYGFMINNKKDSIFSKVN